MLHDLTRRISLFLPILFYALSLAALRLHLPTGDTPLLAVALLAGIVGVGIGVGVVLQHRVMLERVSSRG